MAHIYNSQLDAFDLYHRVQESQAARGDSSLPVLGHAIAGATGSAISNVAVFPLDLVVTRLQIQRLLSKWQQKKSREEGEEGYRDVPDAFSKIYRDEGGVKAFYSGVEQDTAKTVLDSFLFFLAYNFLRQRRLQARSGAAALPVIDELSVGFVAGALAKLVTMPISLIVARRQTAAMTGGGESESSSFRVIARRLYKEKGLRAFWSGYSASLVLTLNPSLTFFLFEFFKRVLLPRSRRANPGPTMVFFMAALGKAVASSTTYPFSLAKTRAQAAGPTEKSKTHNGSRAGTSPFAVIIDIIQHEGVGALYEGLSGEVMKGFFSHGMTMLVKDMVYRFIVRLYYLLVRLRKRTTESK